MGSVARVPRPPSPSKGLFAGSLLSLMLLSTAAPSAEGTGGDRGFDPSGSHPLPNSGLEGPAHERGSCGCTLAAESVRPAPPLGLGAALVVILARRHRRREPGW